MGDAAVRAGRPGARDDGPPPAGHLAAAYRRRPAPAHRGRPGPGPGAAPRPSRRGRRARHRPRRRRRSTRTSRRPARRASATAASTRSRHRGEVAVRGSIVDVFPVHRRPAGAHRPLGRRGRSPDRVLGRRSALHQRRTTRSWLFPCRELLPTDEVRERAAALLASRAVGSGAVGAPGRGPDLRRHGVVAALAVGADEHLLPDLLPDDALVLLVEPAPHARPGARPPRRGGRAGATLWPTWGATGRAFPRLSPAVRPPARPHDGAGWTAVSPRPRRPTRRPRRRPAFDPVVGDGEGLAEQAAGLPPTATGSCSPPTVTGTAGRLPTCSPARASTSHDPRRRPPGRDRHRGRAARTRRRPAGRELAVIAEADLTGRRRAHRAPAPAHAGAPTSTTTSSPATSSCTTSTASAATGHGHARHRRRRARLPAARVPGRRQALRPVRPGRRRPPLHRWRQPVAEPARRRGLAEDEGPGALRGARRSPRSSSSSTAAASPRPGHAFGPDTPWQRELEDAFPYEETPDQAQRDRGREGRHGGAGPDGPPRLRRRRLRQDRGRASAPRSRRCRTASRSRCSCPTTLLANQHGQTFRERFAQLPGAGRGAVALPDHRRAGRGGRGRRRRVRSTW